MRAKIAVATVQGKAYFLIVNALEEQNIPFVSIVPGETVPFEAKAVITTKEEKRLINHQKILVFSGEEELGILTMEAIKILHGKEVYKKIVVGVDPGEVFGLAVVADGKIIYRENCFSVQQVVTKILEILRNTRSASNTAAIKIGNGVPVYKELLKELAEALPEKVVLEVVNEAGTNLPVNRRSRRIRHISSAIQIARRGGQVITRRTLLEANC